jgi:sodium/hydrogen antiporter
MGPHCANIFDPRAWGSLTQRITLEVMRVVLATGLFAIGVELPKSYLADHAKGLLVMVVPTMAFGWIIVAGVSVFALVMQVCLLLVAIIFVLFVPINFISALAIAACLTPTDPIICAAIVGEWMALYDRVCAIYQTIKPTLLRLICAPGGALYLPDFACFLGTGCVLIQVA